MPAFRKYLVVANDSGQSSSESWKVERFTWARVAAVRNLADYDGIILDLAALGAEFPSHIFDGPEINAVFDVNSWAHILGSAGKIYLLGDPEVQVAFPPSIGSFATGGVARMRAADIPKYSPAQPMCSILTIGKDPRPFDFRRVVRTDASENPIIYKYLDRVSDWNYSLSQLGVTQNLLHALINRQVALTSKTFGRTSFNTCVAAAWFCSGPKGVGGLVVLPSATADPGADAIWVAREFLGITTAVPAPAWTKNLTVPEQRDIEERISKGQDAIRSLQAGVTIAESELRNAKRWLRLLYDDGFSLEEIVKEAFETLDATIAKMSKEKEDYRLRVEGYPKAVMEVKGTHNLKFGVGSLRQLANWMDEAIAEQGAEVKGIFLGNAGRTQSPSDREAHLFEENNEKFAQLRDIVIVRAMDLYCVVILAIIGQLDRSAFWREFFDCKGRFDAQKYWASLPLEYKITETA
jgi:hypothetical protein